MLSSDFRAGLPYTLNSELHVRPDRLPSGIQGQAFELALGNLTLGYRQKKLKLVAGAVAGLAPGWKQRIEQYMSFLDKAFERMAAKARTLGVTYRAANAPLQTTEGSDWNAWSGNALQNAADAVQDFHNQVAFAVRNAPLPVMAPASFKALAKSAGIEPPKVKATNLDGLDAIDKTVVQKALFLGLGLGATWWLFLRDKGGY